LVAKPHPLWGQKNDEDTRIGRDRPVLTVDFQKPRFFLEKRKGKGGRADGFLDALRSGRRRKRCEESRDLSADLVSRPMALRRRGEKGGKRGKKQAYITFSAPRTGKKSSGGKVAPERRKGRSILGFGRRNGEDLERKKEKRKGRKAYRTLSHKASFFGRFSPSGGRIWGHHKGGE